jgi:hypothetical protein
VIVELGEESPLLVNQNEVAKYHLSMTGSANWAIALGRFDIHHCMTTFMRTDDHWKLISSWEPQLAQATWVRKEGRMRGMESTGFEAVESQDESRMITLSALPIHPFCRNVITRTNTSNVAALKATTMIQRELKAYSEAESAFRRMVQESNDHWTSFSQIICRKRGHAFRRCLGTLFAG